MILVILQATGFNFATVTGFSSIAVFGLLGSSGYGAANAAMEEAIGHMYNSGIDAISIQWGPWQSVGMVASSKAVAVAMGNLGISMTNPLSGLMLIEQLRYTQDSRRPSYCFFSTTCNPCSAHPISSLLECAGTGCHSSTHKSNMDSNGINGFQNKISLDQETVFESVRSILSDILVVDSIHPQVSLLEYGADSLMSGEIQSSLSSAFGYDLPSTFLFDFPTLQSMSQEICQIMCSLYCTDDGEIEPTALSATNASTPLILNAVAERFPSLQLNDFSAASQTTQDCTEIVPSSRWDINSFSQGAQMGLRFGKFIHNCEYFDNALFGISKIESERMDPQQRILLEARSIAFSCPLIYLIIFFTQYFASNFPEQDSFKVRMMPQSKDNSDSNVAVIIALSFWDYSVESEPFFPSSGDSFKITGRNLSVAAGRISFSMGYNGPSIAVDTACSSSLVALSVGASFRSEYTCTSLTFGSALLCLSVGVMRPLLSASMLSLDGRCKTLDVHADGYGRGEASICMRLSDNGPSLAIIRSVYVNQDGKSASLTAPHGPSQSKVILGALRTANLRPIDLHAQEIHGTGTPLGDPIEINSIAKVHSAASVDSTEETSRILPLTAWKTSLGHSEPASGAVGILHGAFKTRQYLCGSFMHLSSPSKYVTDGMRCKHLQHYLSRQDAPLPHLQSSALVGISAFAFQGTNSHAIAEYKCSEDDSCIRDGFWICTRKFLDLLEQDRFWYAPGVRPGTRCLQASAEKIVWTVEINHQLLDYLRDHKVMGKLIVPGMFFLESIMAALKGSFGHPSNSLGIRNCSIERAIFLNSMDPKYIHIDANFQGIFSVVGESQSGYTPHVAGMLGSFKLRRNRKMDASRSFPKISPMHLENSILCHPVYCVAWRNLLDQDRQDCAPSEIMDAATHLGAILVERTGRLAFIPVSMEVLISSSFFPKHNPSHPWCSLMNRRHSAENRYSRASYFLQSQGQQAQLLELASKGITVTLDQHKSVEKHVLKYDRSFLLEEIVEKHRVVRREQMHSLLTKPRFTSDLCWYDALYPRDSTPERFLALLSYFQLPLTIEKVAFFVNQIPHGESACLHYSDMMRAVLKVASNEGKSTLDAISYHDANSSTSRIFWKVSEKILAHSFDSKSKFQTRILNENSWIVSGGTSGIGLLFGIWNSFQSSFLPSNPSEIVLVSRAGLVSSHMAAGLSSKKNTLRINVTRCDVSFREDARIFQRLKFTTSKVRIFHAAGVIQDALIPKVKAREAFYVYAPKVAGTRNAGLSLSRSPVVDIIMASTISYLIGNRGQASYAAANAEMDGIAFGLNDKGMLARSVLFGPWAGIGMLSSSPNVLLTLSRIGIDAISSQEGLTMINSFLCSRSTFHIVARTRDHFFVIPKETNSLISLFSLRAPKGLKIRSARIKSAIYGKNRQRNNFLETIKSVIESALGRSISTTSPFLEVRYLIVPLISIVYRVSFWY